MVEKNSTEAVEKTIEKFLPESSKSLSSNRKPDISPKLICKSLKDSFSFTLKNYSQSFDETTNDERNEIELTAEKKKRRNKSELKLIVQKSLKQWVQTKKFKMVIKFLSLEILILIFGFRFNWKF